MGKLKDSSAVMFLRASDGQTNSDANNVLQELFHLAGNGFTDRDLARALRKTVYQADERKVFPDGTANIFDPNYNPGYPKAWTKETAYSYYFHKISEQHCGNTGKGITYRNPR